MWLGARSQLTKQQVQEQTEEASVSKIGVRLPRRLEHSGARGRRRSLRGPRTPKICMINNFLMLLLLVVWLVVLLPASCQNTKISKFLCWKKSKILLRAKQKKITKFLSDQTKPNKTQKNSLFSLSLSPLSLSLFPSLFQGHQNQTQGLFMEVTTSVGKQLTDG